ncbi:MAG: hypothetical protein L3K06_01285, partial [Thermoplasmata archaeon]|nr:hypothetical protein [Thermoplasmata archaeon]
MPGAAAALLVLALLVLPALAVGTPTTVRTAPVPPMSRGSTPAPAPIPSAAPTPPNPISAVPPPQSSGHAAPAWTGSFAHAPAAWGASTFPPGAPVARDRIGADRPTGTHGSSAIAPQYGNRSHPVDPHGDCYGIWPTYGGQQTYTNDCYGHDEPGINFYTSLGGSGGNVTWNITLPVSRNLSATQSDLYTAIWFGMTLSDPYGWLDQCFLELQFYPDSDWNVGGPAYGSWVGAAVAWQIEASNGYEDACFYDPLYQGAGGYSEFLMHDGDQISVTMTGWVGNPNGENLTLVDQTNGQVSYVNMYNGVQGYPLNPAYTTATSPNSLQWTPGGELPVVFAFETGHTAPPFPNNNSYGGCSSGVPPPTPVDPATPCPSYDPGSWTNDSVTPWEIQPPTFFNATASERPSQVSFTQDLGGISFIDPLSNYTCSGRDGSAFCSYPWYSYSCATHAFEFGATDYRATSQDFGGYLEYAQNYLTDAAGLGFVPPTNFSIPTCGGVSYNVTVGPTTANVGQAYFLSTALAAPAPFGGLAPGEYALAAIPNAGESFVSWAVSGAVSVAASADPSTTLWVAGNGTVSPTFSATSPTTVTVTVSASVAGDRVVISPSFFYTNGAPLAVLANLGSVSLVPGLYSIQAAAPAGYNFSSWSVSGDGATVAAPHFPFTWLDVPAASSGITLTLRSTASGSYDTIYYSVSYGAGRVSFNGGTATTSGVAYVAVGTYPVTATPSAGWAVSGWYVGSSGVMTDFRGPTNVTLEDGVTYLYAEFEPLVHFRVSPAGAGRISVSYGPPSSSSDQFTSYYSYYLPIIPVPSAGYVFSSWSVSNGAALWAYASGGGGYELEVNLSGTVTATFVTAAAVNLSFASSPASVGGIEFNFQAYGPDTENTSLAKGTYWISELAAPGYNLSGWSTSGPVSVTAAGFVSVTGSGGTLTAKYVQARYPVTITIDPPDGATVTVRPSLGGSSTLASGDTLWLSGGSSQATANLPTGLTLFGWSASPALQVSGTAPATFVVGGPGTLSAHFGGFALSATLSSPTTIDLGQSISASAAALGSGTFMFAWTGLPAGCPGGNVATFRCTPTVVGSYPISVSVLSSDGTIH